MDERILAKLDQLHKEMDEKFEEIRAYIPKADIVSNQRYCEIRTEMGMPLKMRGLRTWFDRHPDCPRHDKHHVSVSKLNKWAEETFKPKSSNA